jgi:hypothetical protein
MPDFITIPHTVRSDIRPRLILGILPVHSSQKRLRSRCFNRRGLVKALAAGAAAASVATPSSAQQTAVLAEATSADYVRDPTHWGSAEVAALFANFKHLDIRTKGAVIRLRHGGSGLAVGLRDPVADRLRRRLELLSQTLD